MSRLSLAGALCCACLMGSGASGAVIFQDNFDNVAVDALPVPTVGAYGYHNGVVKADPSAASNNVLRIAPFSGSVGGRNFAAVTPNAVAGDVVRSTFDAVLSGGDFVQFGMSAPGLGLVSQPNSQTVTMLFALRSDGSIVKYNGSAWVSLPGLTHTAGQWQSYALEYTPGGTTIAITAGGNTAAVSGPFSAASVNSMPTVDRVFVGSGTSTTLGYADNLMVTVVPEPACLAAVGTVAVPFVARRRRFR